MEVVYNIIIFLGEVIVLQYPSWQNPPIVEETYNSSINRGIYKL